jgi:hypothetical protein
VVAAAVAAAAAAWASEMTAMSEQASPGSAAAFVSPAASALPAASASSDGAARLLTALEAFELDEPTAAWSFTQRLAHDNGWRLRYAERAVVEYKRFVALSALAGHVVCPSEQVDQVWHLHLTYTRSYWERLCRDVLGRPLHHAPTAGGAAEHAKHHDLYARTLASYQRLFGALPPADLWPPPDRRFGADLHVVRVNTVENFVVAKAWLWKVAAVAFFVVAAGLLGLVSL